jgi:hypothetical protein
MVCAAMEFRHSSIVAEASRADISTETAGDSRRGSWQRIVTPLAALGSDAKMTRVEHRRMSIEDARWSHRPYHH